MLIWYQRRYLR